LYHLVQGSRSGFLEQPFSNDPTVNPGDELVTNSVIELICWKFAARGHVPQSSDVLHDGLVGSLATTRKLRAFKNLGRRLGEVSPQPSDGVVVWFPDVDSQ
jgi:hypothetical protein